MDKVEVPDFESWSQQCWSPNRIASALEEAFEIGRLYQAQDYPEDWWAQQDADKAWQEEFGVLEQQLEDFKIKNRKERVVQVCNPRTKLYHLINKEHGTISEYGSLTAHAGIRLVTEPTEE